MKLTSTITSLMVLVCLSNTAQTQPLSFFTANSADHVFTQSIQLGKVFHDRNANGYQDLNEEGIPGVRLATVTGLVVETDGYGRYHIVDTNNNSTPLPQNIVIKLDHASLPQGAVLTTENPRVIRSLNAITMQKINFGIHF